MEIRRDRYSPMTGTVAGRPPIHRLASVAPYTLFRCPICEGYEFTDDPHVHSGIEVRPIRMLGGLPSERLVPLSLEAERYLRELQAYREESAKPKSVPLLAFLRKIEPVEPQRDPDEFSRVGHLLLRRLAASAAEHPVIAYDLIDKVYDAVCGFGAPTMLPGTPYPPDPLEELARWTRAAAPARCRESRIHSLPSGYSPLPPPDTLAPPSMMAKHQVMQCPSCGEFSFEAAKGARHNHDGVTVLLRPALIDSRPLPLAPIRQRFERLETHLRKLVWYPMTCMLIPSVLNGAYLKLFKIHAHRSPDNADAELLYFRLYHLYRTHKTFPRQPSLPVINAEISPTRPCTGEAR